MTGDDRSCSKDRSNGICDRGVVINNHAVFHAECHGDLVRVATRTLEATIKDPADNRSIDPSSRATSL